MNKDKIKQAMKKTPIFMICFLLLLVISICFMAFKEKNNIQSSNPNPPKVVFVGDYKIGDDSEWNKYIENKHIPNK